MTFSLNGHPGTEGEVGKDKGDIYNAKRFIVNRALTYYSCPVRLDQALGLHHGRKLLYLVRYALEQAMIYGPSRRGSNEKA